ncbi:hypothetical protein [Ekhidna sp.]|uniref:hypothetical protein n=1 Tax=Ekhidna sp. TaxID=2608089 RepID=UPI0032EC9249
MHWHNSGYERTTKALAPFKLLLYKEDGYATRKNARAREKYLKSGAGKEFLKSLGG